MVLSNSLTTLSTTLMAVVEPKPILPIYSRPQKQIAAKNQGKMDNGILTIYKNLDMSEESCVGREYDVVYGAGLTSKLSRISSLEGCVLQNVMHADPAKIGTEKRYSEESKRISNNLSADDPPLHNSPTNSTCSDEFNQFGYSSYKQERREENCEIPCLTISHLSYSVDQRKSWERLMLRMPKRQFLIRDVSFQLWAGDIMAILSASAYVTNEEFSQPLTVIQYLTITAAIHPPATKHPRIKEMIEQLLATLGLALRRHKLCSTLSRSEATRLRIAAQLLKNTDILVCDNLTKDMDVYETAFIIDYLRDWAIKLNRIVIMCIAPTSFDLLLMFSKCILLTSGRVAYFDCPSKMLNYFESIGYACPAYKNPCDYYVDVVTHDHLSQAASEESMARICKLVQLWEQKSSSPRSTNSSDLPASASLCRPSVLRTLTALYRQNYYKFINAPILSLWEPFTALLVSLTISFSYNSLTREKRVGANDRVAFTVAVLYYGLIPWIYAVVQKVFYEKQDIRSFLRETQLSTIIYLIHKLSCDFPNMVLTSALYTIPLLLLTELNVSNAQQWLWMASLLCIIFTHLILWRFITQTFSFLYESATLAFVTTVLLLTISYLTSGLVSHPASLPSMVSSISPHRWTSQAFLEADFLGRSILESASCTTLNTSELLIGCERKEVLAKRIKGVPIYTISQCSKIRGSQLLYFYGFSENLTSECSLTIYFVFGYSIVISWILVTFFFLTCSVWSSS